MKKKAFTETGGRAVFENHTNYDKSAIQAMTWVFSTKVRRKQYLLRKGWHLGFGILGTLCGLTLLLIFESLDFGERLVAVMALVVCGFALIKGLFLQRIMAWSTLRALHQATGDGERRFVFSEDSFLGIQSGTETVWRYETIQDVYETEGYFLLRFDKLTSSIIDKEGFTQGTAEGFRRFIQGKTGKPVVWAGRHRKNEEQDMEFTR